MCIKKLSFFSLNPPFLFYTNGCMESIAFKLNENQRALHDPNFLYEQLILFYKEILLRIKFIFNSSHITPS